MTPMTFLHGYQLLRAPGCFQDGHREMPLKSLRRIVMALSRFSGLPLDTYCLPREYLLSNQSPGHSQPS